MRSDREPLPVWRRWHLIGLATALPLLEAVVLLALGLRSGLVLAPQASAFGPFGVFHDLRWLFVFHHSVLAFAGGLLVILVGRSLVMAAVIRAAWPAGRRLPSSRRLGAHCLAATAVAAVLLSPWVTLLFGAALVPLSWAFLAAVPAALLTMLLIHHGGIARDWWRRLPPFRSMGWIGASFLVLSVSALLIADGPLPVALAAVVLGGLFNAWAWERSVRSIVIRPARRRPQWVPATAIAVALLLVVVFGGTRIGFMAAADADDSPVAVAPDAGYRGVLLVPGFGAECCDEVTALRELAPDLLVEQYSYLGLDPAGEPVPHSGDATDAELGHLAALMAEQVEELHRRTGRPVAIVAESEGTLVAAVMLERHPEVPTDHLALLSPIVAPGRVTFPDRGEEGPGVVAGWQLRALGGLIDGLAPIPISADGPLTGSLRKCRSEIQTAIVSDRPGIEEIAIVPLADAVTSPAGAGYGIDTVVVPGFHGGLRGRTRVQEMLLSWLAGADLDGSNLWAVLDRIIAGSASAWRVPPLGPYAEPAPAALPG